MRFDPALRYGEDVDLIWRLLDARAAASATTRASSSLHDERDRAQAALPLRDVGRAARRAATPAGSGTSRFAVARDPLAPRAASCTRKRRARAHAARECVLDRRQSLAPARPRGSSTSTSPDAVWSRGRSGVRIRGLPTISGPSIHERTRHQAIPSRPSARRSPASRSRRSTGLRTSADHDERDRQPGRVSVHPRRLPVDVPRAPVDDAPVRRLRHRRGDQRALPLPARPRPDGPLAPRSTCRRLMGHDSDSPRSARRGRPRGRRDRHARRHGDALPGHRPRRRHGLDDHQRARGDDAWPSTSSRPRRTACRRTSSAARSRPTSSRSTSPRRSGASRSTRRCACSAT